MNENQIATVEVENPNGNIDKATAITVAIQHWGRETRAYYEAIEPNGEKAQQEVWTALKKVDGELKDKTDALVAAVGKATAIDRILIQLAAERKAMKKLYEEKWGKYVEIRDKDKPKAPVRAVPLLIYATDAGIVALCDQIKKGKIKGVEGYRTASSLEAEEFIVAQFPQEGK